VRKLRRPFYVLFPLLVTFITFAATQQAKAQEAEAPAEETAEITPPVFGPRVGVGYTTEGSGFESFTSFEGFVPLTQNPGESMTYLQGRLLLDNDSNLAGNILLGHRFYNAQGNRVSGGYVSYDTRDTGNRTYRQLGLGVESLGKWDFRFNGYLPIGETREQIGQSITPFFQGRTLSFERMRQYEDSLHGVDAEIGTRLTKLGSGDLRGYAGLYYYSGTGSEEAFGWKTRLVARPTDYLGLGLSLQHDDLYDTKLVFNVGLNIPGSGARRSRPASDSALARLAESVQRQETIPVAYVTETDSFLATNAAGQPFNFIFVNLGATGGTGTAESPFGTVPQALTVASADTGSNIVYVSGNSTIAPFTVAAGDSVLSSGPVQLLDTAQFAGVRLPGSGTGILPIVTGTVPANSGIITLNSNSVLSGFDVRPTGTDARGIRAASVSGVTIRDNRVTGGSREGIYLENVSGTNTVRNNTITNSTIGIATTLAGTTIGTVQIQNNSITQARTGIDLRVSENATLTSNVSGNTVTGSNTANEGIILRAFDNAKGTTTISSNQVSNVARGLALEASGNATPVVTVSGNTINASRTVGIDPNVSGNADMRLTVSGNTISNTAGIGVEADATEAGKLRLLLSNNRISNSGSLGVSVNASDTADVSVIAENNTLTSNNTVTGRQTPPTPSAFDVAADPFSLGGTPKVCTRLSGNTGSGNTVADYSLYNGNLAGAIFQVANTLASNSGTITLQTFNGTNLVPATVTGTPVGSQAITTGFTSVASGTCAAP